MIPGILTVDLVTVWVMAWGMADTAIMTPFIPASIHHLAIMEVRGITHGTVPGMADIMAMAITPGMATITTGVTGITIIPVKMNTIIMVRGTPAGPMESAVKVLKGC